MCSEEAGQDRASRREVEVTRITLNMDCTGVLQIHTHSSALEVKWPVGPQDSLPSLCGACCCPSGTTSQSSRWPVSVLAPPHRGGLVCNQEPYIGSLQSRETVGMTYRSLHEELHFLCVNSLPKPPPFGLPSLLLPLPFYPSFLSLSASLKTHSQLSREPISHEDYTKGIGRKPVTALSLALPGFSSPSPVKAFLSLGYGHS